MSAFSELGNAGVFLADLHIHSRFSRATSRKLDLPLLAAWAALKGLTVIGTGDFTHPGWREELARDLVLDEQSGLYALRRPEAALGILAEITDSPALRQGVERVRFMLQAEISSIYKRGGKVRKVHNLVYVPSLEEAGRLSLRLEQIGNLSSDGRPILGLDSKDLLELVLQNHPESFLIPAHIWTPWFSLFGSKSGFDSLEECFGDLSGHIFAAETGLSSDPEMNRRISFLDKLKLISNSDAHSGENLGRESNVFSGNISYSGMLEALKAPQDASGLSTVFHGTYEFFPDEGKYHLDGHRDCKVALDPEETRRLGGICPVCGRPVTVGVLYRVRELADRAEPLYRSDENFSSLIPLPELIGEILGVGAKSRKVADFYGNLLRRFGPEMEILSRVPLEDLAKASSPLAQGLERMRKGQVHRQGGFDGEYGVIRVFTPEERRDLEQKKLFVLPESAGKGDLLSLGGAAPARRRAGAAAARQQPEAAPASALSGLAAKKRATGPEPGAVKAQAKACAAENKDPRPEEFEAGPKSAAPLKSEKESAPRNKTADNAQAPALSGRAVEEQAVYADVFEAISHGEPVPPGPEDDPGQARGPGAPSPLSPDIALSRLKRLAREKNLGDSALARLNPRQAQAVLAGLDLGVATGGGQRERAEADGQDSPDSANPVLVLAGPGTGKTQTLVARICALLALGMPPDEILALTFTRRAARELDERLRLNLAPLLPPEGYPGRDEHLPRTDTLHALAYQFWRQANQEAPLLLTEDAARRIFEETNLELPAQKRRAAWEAIGLCREKLQPLPEDLQAAYTRYTQHKAAWNLADYTDLLEFWLTQLRSGRYPVPWLHILVDEIQDLSPLQLELIKALAPPLGRGFFGIGDPHQSIYGFRGAAGDVDLYFRRAWPHLQCVFLKENYRSGMQILDLAQGVYKPGAFRPERDAAAPEDSAVFAPAEKLLARSEGPCEIHFFEANSAESEATWVAGMIRRFLGGTSHSLQDAQKAEDNGPLDTGDYSPGDFAILMRSRMFMEPLRRALERAGIPCSQPSLDPFWNDERIRKILELVGRLLGISTPLPNESGYKSSLPDIPERVLLRGPRSMAAFWGNSDPFDARFWKSKAFEEFTAAFESHGGWPGLFNWLALQNELELVREKGETVQLLTLHAAKGLEFRMVFMPGLEDGVLPFVGTEFFSGQSRPGGMDLAEEQRLFYVGLTRARQGLFLSHSEKRRLHGKELRLKPSRFLKNLPRKNIKHRAVVARTETKAEQLKLF
ncbi:UvrD-helicase domain-containing protein [Desulfovibrio sp. OttesenSCG-928-C14]|nr:UvrD-helicase domain-containing protein [Desulfovibrio sp. OttesenSCG-928-C14]